ncbi:unnamed protein product [Trichobilharzia szidati]|nr:unnamed protein product [Trichobilharzia szidati]
MVRFIIARAGRSASLSRLCSRFPYFRNSPIKEKFCTSLVSVSPMTSDAEFASLLSCCVKVEPLSSLPVEYASVITRPCSIVCEVTPLSNSESVQKDINENDMISAECQIALPALPLSLEDYTSPAPSLVRDDISLYVLSQ